MPLAFTTSWTRSFLSTPSARRATSGNLLETLQKMVFLSTPSARRATQHEMGLLKLRELFLSTPSARRATSKYHDERTDHFISIHALCEEGDKATVTGLSRVLLFLSTPSARRATKIRLELQHETTISIHALCEEGDSKNRDKISIFKQIIQHSARI